MPNLETKNNFHVFFLGLDRHNLTIKELYQEINIKLKMLVGEVPHENIMIIDPASVETEFLNSEQFSTNEKVLANLKKMGRIACINFKSVLDAFAVLTNKAQVTLPLFDGSNREPVIICSTQFQTFVEQTTPNCDHFMNLVNSFESGGEIFKVINKEITETSESLKGFWMGGNNNRFKGKKGKGGGKKFGDKGGEGGGGFKKFGNKGGDGEKRGGENRRGGFNKGPKA